MLKDTAEAILGQYSLQACFQMARIKKYVFKWN